MLPEKTLAQWLANKLREGIDGIRIESPFEPLPRQFCESYITAVITSPARSMMPRVDVADFDISIDVDIEVPVKERERAAVLIDWLFRLAERWHANEALFTDCFGTAANWAKAQTRAIEYNAVTGSIFFGATFSANILTDGREI